MTDQPWHLIERDDYVIRWRWPGADHRAIIKWEVHIVAGKMEGRMVYADERHHDSGQAFRDPKYEPIDGGHILHGTSKFDGCTDVQQSRPDCMMHFCNSDVLVAIFKDVHAFGKVFLEETGSGWE